MIKLLQGRTRARKIIFLAMAVGVIAVAAFVGYGVISRKMPLQLPAPIGSYAVGRVEYDWVDQSRSVPLADQPDTPRELAVWVWDPADAAGNTPATYLPPVWAQARQKDQGIGSELLQGPSADTPEVSFEKR